MEKKTSSQSSNSIEEKVQDVSSLEEMVAILEGRTISVTENGESINFYLKESEKKEVAHQIAELYIKQFPRPNYYPAHLESSEDDSERLFYHQLTEEEYAIIQNCYSDPEIEWDLEEYLEEKGHTDLLEKLLEHDSPMPLNILRGCDLSAPLKFTDFSIQFKKDDGSLSGPIKVGCPLTDAEFVELLEQCLLTSNKVSMNMLVYRKPELAQRIIRHLLWNSDFLCELSMPSICELDELKSVAKSILDPYENILKLFGSEDIKIRAFIKEHVILEESKE